MDCICRPYCNSVRGKIPVCGNVGIGSKNKYNGQAAPGVAAGALPPPTCWVCSSKQTGKQTCSRNKLGMHSLVGGLRMPRSLLPGANWIDEAWVLACTSPATRNYVPGHSCLVQTKQVEPGHGATQPRSLLQGNIFSMELGWTGILQGLRSPAIDTILVLMKYISLNFQNFKAPTKHMPLIWVFCLNLAIRQKAWSS